MLTSTPPICLYGMYNYNFTFVVTPYINNIQHFNPLKPNDLKKRRTAQLTSRCCILYIYSTNKRTEYFKHAA